MSNKVTILEADEAAVAKAVVFLQEGRLVAFPTETVYGLGCDARNDKAVASVYAAKGRPDFNPLIIHVATPSDLDPLVVWNEAAKLLALQFWPGPLTLVLPRAPGSSISYLASAGLETIAVRVPSHPIAQDLLRRFNGPIAAPSANASGKLSPTAPFHVAESLGNKVDLILAGGKSSIGIESTVLDLVSPTPRILRPGAVTIEQIERVIGPLAQHDANDQKGRPASPGLLASHYAPHVALRMNATSAETDEAFLLFGPDILLKGGALRLNLSEVGDINEAAANLFAMLRQLDQASVKGIAVAPIPHRGLGVAINDRLRRASAERPLP